MKISFDEKDLVNYGYCPKRWETEKKIVILKEFKKGKQIKQISEVTGSPEDYVESILKEHKYL